MQEQNDSRQTPPPTPSGPEFERIRRQRNIVMGLLLAAFVVLVFAISLVKMG